MKTLLALICVLLSTVVDCRVLAQISLTGREVWFGENGSFGSGTIADPYTSDHFDYALRGIRYGNGTWAVSTNVTINLHPGSYEIRLSTNHMERVSRGGFSLRGSGIGSTYIYLGIADSSTTDFWLFKGDSGADDWGHFRISDLTIDCSWGEEDIDARRVGAIKTKASSGEIERVRVYDFGSSISGSVDVLVWQVPGDGVGSFAIRNSLIEGPIFGSSAVYGSGILLLGSDNSAEKLQSSCIISGNHFINFYPETTTPKYGTGVELSGVHNVQVANNIFRNVGQGVSGVSLNEGTMERIKVYNNLMVNCGAGMRFGNSGGMDSIIVKNNTIVLNDYMHGYTNYPPVGVEFRGGVENSVIEGNVVQLRDDLKGTSRPTWYGLYVEDRVGLVNEHVSVTGNIVPVDTSNDVSTNQAPRIQFNYTESGGAMAH